MLPWYRYENNSGLCGFPLPTCEESAHGNSSCLHQGSGGRRDSLSKIVALGLLFSLICIGGMILIAVEIRKRKRRDKENSDSSRDFFTNDSRTNSGTLNSNCKLTGTETLSINLATFDKPLRKLTFTDLLETTNGFHNDSRIGSGGFGNVYKAQLKDGSVVAIKKMIHVSGQDNRELMAEMETIDKIKHWNLVPLLGYNKVGEEWLLVYEYMKHRSLEDVLHDRKKAKIKLNWAARRKDRSRGSQGSRIPSS